MKTNNTDSVQNQGLFSFQCLKPVGQRSLWHQSSSLYLGVSLNMKFLHPTLHPQKQQRHWNSEPQHDDGKRRMFIFFWILRWQMCLKTNRHSRTNDLTVWMSAKTKMTRRKNHNKKKKENLNLCQLAKQLKSCSDSRFNCCVCADAAPTQSLALSSMLLLLLLLHGHTQAVPVGTTTNNVNQCHSNFYISRGLSGFYTRCTCSWTSFSKRWTLCSCRSTSVSWAEMCEDRPERRSDCLFKRTWNTNKQRWIREPEIGHTIWLFFFFFFIHFPTHFTSTLQYRTIFHVLQNFVR